MELAVLNGMQFAERELLLFAAFWLIIGALDELVVDALWLRLLVKRRARSRKLPEVTNAGRWRAVSRS